MIVQPPDLSVSTAQALRDKGIVALRQGDKRLARTLLEHAVMLNRVDAYAWLWLSGAVESNVEQRDCLERVLQLDPGNSPARRGLVMLSVATPQPSATSPLPPARYAGALLGVLSGVLLLCIGMSAVQAGQPASPTTATMPPPAPTSLIQMARPSASLAPLLARTPQPLALIAPTASSPQPAPFLPPQHAAEGITADMNQQLNMDPAYAAAYSDRGRAYLALGNIPAAIADWQRAAVLYRQLGRWDEYQRLTDAIGELRITEEE